MAMAKVYNDNFLPFTQTFEDETIHIEPEHFITMDFEKAHKFAGTYFPVAVDAGGRQKPESFKKIRVVKIGKGEEPAINNLKCQACSFIGQDKQDLDGHITSKHIGVMLDKDEVKKRTRAS